MCNDRENCFIAKEEQIAAITPKLCPVNCPHKREERYVNLGHLKKSAPLHSPHGFISGYWCEKYRSVLGSHLLNPGWMIFDGEPKVLVMKSPFCPDNSKD